MQKGSGWEKFWQTASNITSTINDAHSIYSRSKENEQSRRLGIMSRSINYENEQQINQVNALLRNIRELESRNSALRDEITEKDKMLIQQNNILVNNNVHGQENVSGSDFLASFYSLSKSISITDTYAMLSYNVQQKLPFGDYNN